MPIDIIWIKSPNETSMARKAANAPEMAVARIGVSVIALRTRGGEVDDMVGDRKKITKNIQNL